MQFGGEAVRKLQDYSRSRSKLATLVNRRNFLLQCRRHGLTPRHIVDRLQNLKYAFEFHDHRTGQQTQDFYTRLEHKVLNLEISITIKNIKALQHHIDDTTGGIVSLIPLEIWQEFQTRQNIVYNNVFREVRSRLQNKFNMLRRSQDSGVPVQQRWFRNISDVDIPTDIADFLALGPKFSIPPDTRDISIPGILAEIESIDFSNHPDLGSMIPARVTNILTNFVQKPKTTGSQQIVLYYRTRSFLKQHPELIITQADKGNSTVCMSRDEYVNLSNSILSDDECYRVLRRDPTSTLQQRANKLIADLKRKKMVDDMLAHKCMIYNSKPARFYGLPKIHKPQLALRPIISSLSCPNSKVAKLVTDILTNSYNKDNTYFISDSFHFSRFINDFQIPRGFVLVSFDVVSLFTNIPLQLVIDSIKKRWHDIRRHTQIESEEFLQLVDYIFNSTYFSFQGTFYKQVFGTPMGSVISPIIAQLVMDDILDEISRKLPFNFPFIKKFVDDIICSIPEDQIDSTLNIFNSVDNKIQFTVEKENNNAVPFLDMLLIREEQVVRTDWYTKPSASGRYINYRSYHSTKMKINTVLNMKRRVWELSHPLYRLNNLTRLSNIMQMNSFPKKLINKLLYSTPIRAATPQVPEGDISATTLPGNDPVSPGDVQTADTVIYKSLPYEVGLSKKLIPILTSIPGIKVALYNTKTIRDLYTPLKDRTPILQQSNVVYKIPCLDCQLVYIGQTSRSISGRIISHKSDIRRGVNNCLLAKHANEVHHSIDYSSVSVLDTAVNYKKRSFLEMVRILQHDNAMNSRKDIEGLSNVYRYLIHLDAKKNRSPTTDTNIDTSSSDS